MRKPALILLVVGLIVAGGVSIYVYRNIEENKNYIIVPQKSAQNITAQAPPQSDPSKEVVTRRGDFAGRDAVHRSSGQASVIETANGPLLQFENFSVTPGPDLFVYLSPNGPTEDLGTYVSLDRLKSTAGTQTYNLPENYKDYKTVVIWCRAFSVTFATAELLPV